VKGLTLLFLFTVPMLASCDRIAQTNDSEIAQAKTLLSDALLDPQSAQFRKIAVGESDLMGNKQSVVCGEVNAKNRMGGYTGYGHFLVATDGTLVWLENQPLDHGASTRIRQMKYKRMIDEVCNGNNVSALEKAELAAQEKEIWANELRSGQADIDKLQAELDALNKE
jgi:hypothetical protein